MERTMTGNPRGRVSEQVNTGAEAAVVDNETISSIRSRLAEIDRELNIDSLQEELIQKRRALQNTFFSKEEKKKEIASLETKLDRTEYPLKWFIVDKMNGRSYAVIFETDMRTASVINSSIFEENLDGQACDIWDKPSELITDKVDNAVRFSSNGFYMRWANRKEMEDAEELVIDGPKSRYDLVSPEGPDGSIILSNLNYGDAQRELKKQAEEYQAEQLNEFKRTTNSETFAYAQSDTPIDRKELLREEKELKAKIAEETERVRELERKNTVARNTVARVARGSRISYDEVPFEVREIEGQGENARYKIVHPSGKPIYNLTTEQLTKVFRDGEATLLPPENPPQPSRRTDVPLWPPEPEEPIHSSRPGARVVEQSGAEELRDPAYEQAVRIVSRRNTIALSTLSRELGIDERRATQIFNMMHRDGIIGDTARHGGWPVDVLMNPTEIDSYLESIRTTPEQVREYDPMYIDALRIVFEMGKASTSTLQRRLRLGYGHAAAMLDMMGEDHVIGPADGSRPRDVLMGENEIEGYIKNIETRQEPLQPREPARDGRQSNSGTSPNPPRPRPTPGRPIPRPTPPRPPIESGSRTPTERLREVIANAKKVIKAETEGVLAVRRRKRIAELRRKLGY
ncbi:MAG TPA: DNA translocase FtsK [Candidatus Paceibacterota bacterium]|nr:DNA translocase FtsK [Candidatus Paceibacterota bacterium]